MFDDLREKLPALLVSRRVWKAIATMLFVVGNEVYALGVSAETLETATFVVFAWIFGDSIRSTGGESWQEKLNAMLNSRRFWLEVSGVALIVTNSYGLQLSETAIQTIAFSLAALIVGDSWKVTK